jgi:predicted RNase H-like HicB family nuclease
MATVPHPPDEKSSVSKEKREKRNDGRWLAGVPELPGVMAYGTTVRDAEVNVTARALRVLAEANRANQKIPEIHP